MPKRTAAREQTTDDIRAMWQRLIEDYPGWTITLNIHMQYDRWFVIVARAYMGGADGGEAIITARVYSTPRSPSYMTDQWKALFGLHMQIERHLSGLPLLIGY